jgi:hypothetical protein
VVGDPGLEDGGIIVTIGSRWHRLVGVALSGRNN